ncbi:hypothetical protein LOSG293_130100 [Secundilactobacillus oryzae JCM 18671]|uniref:Uncharacterized protein n=1 Tax=Secundilactobacillus oryzae JCM 18671 TaxID=1291743 RepID=A0A081BIF3_9LACO|nr:hypothetical protein [Secundilactobacillus oryzae]GAK47821.1 hypothetical protein LOSG293_130100 [Secundilactobacillus oryzae JCM 18671]
MGEVKNSMYVAFYGGDNKGAGRYAYTQEDWESKYPGFVKYFGPQTAQLVNNAIRGGTGCDCSSWFHGHHIR